MARHLTLVRQPQKLPVVLTLEEVARLIEAAPGPKYKAALGVSYGAGLRVSEVANLRVSDIDSERMVIRVEQGKGRKDRKIFRCCSRQNSCSSSTSTQPAPSASPFHPAFSPLPTR